MKPEIRQAGAILIALAVLSIVGCVLAAIVGCQPPPSVEPESQPVEPVVAEPTVPVDLVADAKVPPEDRQGNWGPSCGWAAMGIVLQEHGLPKTAEAFRANYHGGTTQPMIEAACRESGLGFAETTAGDVEFLWWCDRTGRKASLRVLVPSGRGLGGHRIVFYGFHEGRAYYVDVNDPKTVWSRPTNDFLKWWREAGGEACTSYAYGSQPPTPPRWEKFRGRETTYEPVASKAAGDHPGPGAARVAPVVHRDGPIKRLVERLRERRVASGGRR